MTSIADASTGNYVSGIGYNSAEQVTGWALGNGVVEGFGYDANRLQMTSQSATRSGNTLLSLNYSYNALSGQNGSGSTAGNAAQLMSVSGTINGTTESAGFTYDLQGRLATSSQTQWSERAAAICLRPMGESNRRVGRGHRRQSNSDRHSSTEWRSTH